MKNLKRANTSLIGSSHHLVSKQETLADCNNGVLYAKLLAEGVTATTTAPTGRGQK